MTIRLSRRDFLQWSSLAGPAALRGIDRAPWLIEEFERRER